MSLDALRRPLDEPRGHAGHLLVGRVLNVDPANDTVDVALVVGGLVRGARLLRQRAGRREGQMGMPLITPARGLQDLDTDPGSLRDCWCVVGFAAGQLDQPVVLGFLYPTATELALVGPEGVEVDRHQSDHYLLRCFQGSVADGTARAVYECVHPDGSYLRFGPAVAGDDPDARVDLARYQRQGPDGQDLPWSPRQDPPARLVLAHASGARLGIDETGLLYLRDRRDAALAPLQRPEQYGDSQARPARGAVDFGQLRVFRLAVHNSLVTPAAPVQGELWFDAATAHKLGVYDGARWQFFAATYQGGASDTGKPLSIRPLAAQDRGTSYDAAAVDHQHAAAMAQDSDVQTIRPANQTAASAANADRFAYADHRHAAAMAQNSDVQTIRPANQTAASAANVDRFAYADHRHAVAMATSGDPQAVVVGGSGGVGSADRLAYADHSHGLAVGQSGDSQAIVVRADAQSGDLGQAARVARADHTHHIAPGAFDSRYLQLTGGTVTGGTSFTQGITVQGGLVAQGGLLQYSQGGYYAGNPAAARAVLAGNWGVFASDVWPFVPALSIAHDGSGPGAAAGLRLGTGGVDMPSWEVRFFTVQNQWWHAFGSSAQDVHWGYDGQRLRLARDSVGGVVQTLQWDSTQLGVREDYVGGQGLYVRGITSSTLYDRTGRYYQLQRADQSVYLQHDTVANATSLNGTLAVAADINCTNGTVSCKTLSASNAISGGALSIANNASVGGALSCGSLSSSGAVSGTTLSASGGISGNTLTLFQGASVAGTLACGALQCNGQVSGNTLSIGSGGSVTGTLTVGALFSGGINGTTLALSQGASVAGTLACGALQCNGQVSGNTLSISSSGVVAGVLSTNGFTCSASMALNNGAGCFFYTADGSPTSVLELYSHYGTYGATVRLLVPGQPSREAVVLRINNGVGEVRADNVYSVGPPVITGPNANVIANLQAGAIIGDPSATTLGQYRGYLFVTVGASAYKIPVYL